MTSQRPKPRAFVRTEERRWLRGDRAGPPSTGGNAPFTDVSDDA